MWYTVLVSSLIVLTSSVEKAGTVIQERIISTDLLPNTRYCGRQHSDDYFHTGVDTAITSFPWMAILLYGTNEKSGKIGCTGSLINSKYVLTSAHCTQANTRGSPDGVRLGDYHIKNETDCTDDSKVHECSDSIEDFQIEKIIPHPNFVRKTFSSLFPIAGNDIALIRLKGSVMYSDYIRPICLPLPESKKPNAGDVLVLPGWNILAGDSPNIEQKAQLDTNLTTNKECLDTYNKILSKSNIIMTLAESQMCGSIVVDGAALLCSGNRGGPLLYRAKKAQWYQQGILSFLDGYTSCSQGGIYPEIFTKVEYYLDWITENLEP